MPPIQRIGGIQVYQTFRWWGVGTICLTAIKKAIRQIARYREVSNKKSNLIPMTTRVVTIAEAPFAGINPHFYGQPRETKPTRGAGRASRRDLEATEVIYCNAE